MKQGEPASDIRVGIVPQSGSAGKCYTMIGCLLQNNAASSDYDTRRATAVFSPGDPDEKTVRLSVRNDNTLEANETYFLQLDLSDAARSAGARLGPRNRAEVTIINDDGKIK